MATTMLLVIASSVTFLAVFGPTLSPVNRDQRLRVAARAALNSETRVVFVGSSHVYCGVRPESFESPVMNITMGGMDYQCMELVLAKNIERMPGLRLAVIELGYVPLRSQLIKETFDYQPALSDWGLTPFDLPISGRRKYKCLKTNFKQSIIGCRLTPTTISAMIRRVQETPVLIADAGMDDGLPPEAGHMPSNVVMTAESDGAAAVRRHRGLDGNIAVNQAALIRLLKNLHERGVSTALMIYPHHATYWRSRPDEWEKELKELLSVVHGEPGLGDVPVWDYGSLEMFEDSDFWNGDHLNSVGAEKFTAFLNAQLQTPVTASRSMP